jgi:hypothetical protein
LFAAVFAAGATSQAGASTVTLVGGTLGIGIGALPPIGFPNNSNPVLSVSSGAGSFTEPASVFTGSVMLPTGLFTGVALINGLTIANLANGQKFIAPGAVGGGQATGLDRVGGNLGGSGPLAGSALINVGFLFNLTVPLNVIGDTGATTFAGVPGGIEITVLGTGWTTGNITVTGITTGAPATNTVVNVGFDNRGATPQGGGVVQLISSFKAITNAAGNLPGLATQTLTFVPEPGTILLLLSGVATLGIGGWLRVRRK